MASPVEEGSTLDSGHSHFEQNFDNKKVLGKGGYGVVFSAVSHMDSCNYAIKRITLSGSRKKRAQAMREVQALACLDHPGIVRYYHAWAEPILMSDDTLSVISGDSSLLDTDDTESTCSDVFDRPSQDYLYIQMELCQKETLKCWLKKHNVKRDYAIVSDMVYQIANAVAYIHSRNFVHRDLNPSNILFSLSHSVKVGDFGLVTYTQHEGPGGDFSSHLNRTKNAGTWLYMSPEQTAGGNYNEKVDMFALGVILLEMCLTFGSETERVKILSSAKCLILPDNFRHEWPRESAVIRRLLAASTREDFPSAQDFLNIHRFLFMDYRDEAAQQCNEPNWDMASTLRTTKPASPSTAIPSPASLQCEGSTFFTEEHKPKYHWSESTDCNDNASSRTTKINTDVLVPNDTLPHSLEECNPRPSRDVVMQLKSIASSQELEQRKAQVAPILIQMCSRLNIHNETFDIEPFDGSCNGEEWLRRFYLLAEKYAWDANEKLWQMKFYMNNKAGVWLMSLSAMQTANFHELEKCFKNQYIYPETMNFFQSPIYSSVDNMNANELISYPVTLESVMQQDNYRADRRNRSKNRSSGNIPIQSRNQAGVQPPSNFFNPPNERNTEERPTDDLGAYHKRNKKFVRIRSPDSARKKTNADVQDRRPRCYRCGEVGHFVANCILARDIVSSRGRGSLRRKNSAKKNQRTDMSTSPHKVGEKST